MTPYIHIGTQTILKWLQSFHFPRKTSSLKKLLRANFSDISGYENLPDGGRSQVHQTPSQSSKQIHQNSRFFRWHNHCRNHFPAMMWPITEEWAVLLFDVPETIWNSMLSRQWKSELSCLPSPWKLMVRPWLWWRPVSPTHCNGTSKSPPSPEKPRNYFLHRWFQEAHEILHQRLVSCCCYNVRSAQLRLFHGFPTASFPQPTSSHHILSPSTLKIQMKSTHPGTNPLFPCLTFYLCDLITLSVILQSFLFWWITCT